MATSIKQIIAFDFGLKQIGVATGSILSGMATELCVLKAKDGKPDWQEVTQFLEEWRPDICLVGLPLNMDDSESDLSARARKFANQLHGRSGIAIEFVDERLTSFEAKNISREMGHKGDYKEAPIDALAAKLLAEQWLRQNS